MKEVKKRSDCPISQTLDVLGDKWSLLIIRDMMFDKKSTYGDFLKSAEGIATNILASRLQNLEDNNLIVKLEHPESKAKFLYKLTEKAIDLLPIIVEIHLWADRNFQLPDNIKAMINEGKEDKEKFIKTMKDQLRAELQK